MDEGDIATDYAERFVAEALSAHRSPSGESLDHCVECGEPIPLARQQAIAGVELCIHCAERAERGRA